MVKWGGRLSHEELPVQLENEYKRTDRSAKPKKPLGFASEVQEDSDPSFGLDAVMKSTAVTPPTLACFQAFSSLISKISTQN